MQGVVLFICCAIFSLGSYLIWPSRFNIVAHISISVVFLAYFIPLIILDTHLEYPSQITDLYTALMLVGAVCYVAGLFTGFAIKPVKTNFSFEVMSVSEYEKRIAQITRLFLIISILGMIIGFCMMGYIPMFADDPLAAKFFRNQYQVPFYTSIVYLSSFFILSTVTPISLIIWYNNKKRSFFLWATLAAITLMSLSLARGPSFTGIVYVTVIILAAKGRGYFVLALVMLFSIYSFSSVFYFVLGVKNLADFAGGTSDHLFWRILSSGTVDVDDHLGFLQHFEENPIWTYGRTIYGGFIPGHYEWNPAVYTLKIMNPGEDVTTLVSGGLRLPVSIWGYVSFQWPGVILFCFIAGVIKGVICKYLKTWISEHKSVLIITVLFFISLNIFEPLGAFYLLSIYLLPPMFILIFYLYRVKLK